MHAIGLYLWSCNWAIKIFPILKFHCIYLLLLVLSECCCCIVQLPRCVWLFATPWTEARQASLSFPSPKVCPTSCSLHQWCHPSISSPLLLLPSIFPRIRDFSNESVLCIRWPKYYGFSSDIYVIDAFCRYNFHT